MADTGSARYNEAMADTDRVARWIDGYVRAWNSNDPTDIGALFTDDAAYHTAPFRTPWRGRQQIIDGWLDRKDEPGEATFEWHLVLDTDDLSVVQGTTTYPDETFSNLWLIRLDADGRSREFTEWWMEQPRS
ncbi:MAG: nuclear transport factor 2 family protein [Candidatus Nanopelagicales bacterium]